MQPIRGYAMAVGCAASVVFPCRTPPRAAPAGCWPVARGNVRAERLRPRHSTSSAAYRAATTGVTVTVALSADPERDVTVTLQGGAEAADYTGVPANVSFAAGESSQTFVVVAEDDALNDDGESLELGFENLPTGVTAGTPATTTVRLDDNDVPAVTVAYGAATYTATEGAAAGVTVTVALSGDPERAVTVPVTVTLQGGAEAADYSGVPENVSFAAGETSATFVVVAEDDVLDDDGSPCCWGSRICRRA